MVRRCVVIGAGVLGACVTARLAGSGMQVTLLDAGQPGQATSRWSFAWLNSNDKAPRHYHNLNRAGMKAWAGLAPDLDGAAWYRPAGHLELAAAAGAAAAGAAAAARGGLAARVHRLAQWGYPARLVDPAEAAALEPALRPCPGAAAAWFGEEGYVLTGPLIARLIGRAQDHGAVVLTGDQGRVTAIDRGWVRTADGSALPADDVVVCAGRWTPRLAALAGSASPVPLVSWDTPGATAPGLVVRVGPVTSPGPVRILHTPDLALRPHADGLVQLEAPDAVADLYTPRADLDRWAAELLARARRTVRGLDDAQVVDCTVCVRPLPADGMSIVGRLPGADWLYVAVTHSAVTLAAHLSGLIAADLTGAQPPELAPYRPARFRPLGPEPSSQHAAGEDQQE